MAILITTYNGRELRYVLGESEKILQVPTKSLLAELRYVVQKDISNFRLDRLQTQCQEFLFFVRIHGCFS